MTRTLLRRVLTVSVLIGTCQCAVEGGGGSSASTTPDGQPDVRLELPASVPRQTPMRFAVTVRNPLDEPIALERRDCEGVAKVTAADPQGRSEVLASDVDAAGCLREEDVEQLWVPARGSIVEHHRWRPGHIDQTEAGVYTLDVVVR